MKTLDSVKTFIGNCNEYYS